MTGTTLLVLPIPLYFSMNWPFYNYMEFDFPISWNRNNKTIWAQNCASTQAVLQHMQKSAHLFPLAKQAADSKLIVFWKSPQKLINVNFWPVRKNIKFLPYSIFSIPHSSQHQFTMKCRKAFLMRCCCQCRSSFRPASKYDLASFNWTDSEDICSQSSISPPIGAWGMYEGLVTLWEDRSVSS